MAQEQKEQNIKDVTVQLNGKVYKVDSFPEQEKVALVQIEQIEIDIERAKIQQRNLDYAKQFLVDYLSKNTDKFEEVPQAPQDASDTPANNVESPKDSA